MMTTNKIEYYKLFLLLFLSVTILFGCAQRRAKEAYKMAEELFKGGNYKEAVAKYVEVIKYDKPIPEVEDSYYKMGEIYSRYLEDPNSAVYYLEQMITKFPESTRIPDAKKGIAYSYLYKLNKPDKALEQLEFIEKNYPKVSFLDEVVYYKAKSLIALNKYDDAYKSIENFSTIFPNSKYLEETEYQKGLLLFNSGKYKQAIEQYNGYIQKYPKGSYAPLAKFDIGVAQENLGNYKEALETFKSIGPEYPNQEALKIKIQKLEERLKKKSKAAITRTPSSVKKERLKNKTIFKKQKKTKKVQKSSTTKKKQNKKNR